mgnify:FL=1
MPLRPASSVTQNRCYHGEGISLIKYMETKFTVRRDKAIDALAIQTYLNYPDVNYRILGQIFGISERTVWVMMKENGIKTNFKRKRTKILPHSLEAELDKIRLEASRLIKKQIDERFGRYQGSDVSHRSCCICHEMKPFTKEFFIWHYKHADGQQLYGMCKKCKNERQNLKRKNSLDARIKKSMSGQVANAIRDKNYSRTFDIVGYSVKELMEHLKAQFEPGMTWENYGEWEIDHFRPMTSFKMESKEDEEFKLCFALKNLRPLWSRENRRKRDKLLFNWKYDLIPLAEELFQLS